MKRFFVLAVCVLMLAGCSAPTASSITFTEEEGGSVIETEGRKTTMIDTAPHAIKYNDNHVTLRGVGFFESVSNYDYTLYIIIEIDVDNLSDEELHWLREGDLSVNTYITSEKNKYDFDRAVEIGSVMFADAKRLIYVLRSSLSGGNRHSFANSECVAVIAIEQEDTYEYTGRDSNETSTLNMVEEVRYAAQTGDIMRSAEEIEKPVYDKIVEWQLRLIK